MKHQTYIRDTLWRVTEAYIEDKSRTAEEVEDTLNWYSDLDSVLTTLLLLGDALRLDEANMYSRSSEK